MTTAGPDRSTPGGGTGSRRPGTAPTLLVEAVGAGLVQDLGRPGLAHLGVARSGAADRAALGLANRLVANPVAAAGLEVLLGGLVLRATGRVTLAVTGADVELRARGRVASRGAPLALADGDLLELGPARSGLRAYVAVRGGLTVPAVLGSRSRDTLAALGPRPLRAGDVLAVGAAPSVFPVLDAAPLPAAGPADGTGAPAVVARVRPGPRLDHLLDSALATLLEAQWRVDPASDRIGIRLIGPVLPWRRGDELPSEGVVRGALQVPPSGQPVILGPDHPVTGGYPVVAVVLDADQDRLAQVRPGDPVRFARA